MTDSTNSAESEDSGSIYGDPVGPVGTMYGEPLPEGATESDALLRAFGQWGRGDFGEENMRADFEPLTEPELEGLPESEGEYIQREDGSWEPVTDEGDAATQVVNAEGADLPDVFFYNEDGSLEVDENGQPAINQVEMRRAAAALTDEFPQLADPKIAEATVAATRQWAQQVGVPELAHDPRVWRMVTLAAGGGLEPDLPPEPTEAEQTVAAIMSPGPDLGARVLDFGSSK